MKRYFSIVLCVALLIALSSPVLAAEQDSTVSYRKITLNNGITIIDEITECSEARFTDKAYRKTRTFKDGDTVIAIIAIQATFRYDGTTVSVVAKAVAQTDTYDGWNYKQTSFTSSGGTVTLNAELTKLLVFNNPFTMTLSCDKDGNIT